MKDDAISIPAMRNPMTHTRGALAAPLDDPATAGVAAADPR